MTKKLFGFINKSPLNWFHYLPLVGVIIFAYYQSIWLGLMDLVKTNPVAGWSWLIALYYLNLLIGDNLIHFIIGED